MAKETITLLFDTNGNMTVQDEPGENAEKRLKFLLDGMGDITRRGHKAGQKHEEGVTIKNG